MMFDSILIANRGEIACRVIRTCRRLGIRSIAVYSDADARAMHVAEADEAWRIGPAPARDSYLSIPRIIDAAKRAGAQAIHPGYGFLSENFLFVEACEAAGLTFIGPPAAAMRAMGSKAAAKALMAEAGVPLVPGYHGADQDVPTLIRAALDIGYPVLIKASAGGGGKGMRIVETADALPAALDGARAEAASSFGDDRLLIERYLTRPRHIEIQVFADRHGRCVSLYERDCSIQRRHQKVLEEAPAPGMDPARRAAMGEAAIAAARAVGYVGAGTVEFIAEADRYYFMEMNTRLQVEHPVTEMITGLDLVEWQLRVAAGEPLPDDIPPIDGHAIEARIYAEDPARDFLPSIGRLTYLRQPAATPEVRIDTGVREGDAIPPDYDPMIAKLIVHGPDRPTALRRLTRALADYAVVGVQTNLALLRAIAAHPDFAAGAFDTGFIGHHPAVLAVPPFDRRLVLAAAALRLLPSRDLGVNDPWAVADGFRIAGPAFHDLHLEDAAGQTTVRAHPRAGGWRLDFADGSVEVAGSGDMLRIDDALHRIPVVGHESPLAVLLAGQPIWVRARDPLAPPASTIQGVGSLIAPIPARVTRVLAKPGDAVSKGTVLVVLEAMKMEISLIAPADGIIEALPYGVGEMVEEGAWLVTFRVNPLET